MRRIIIAVAAALLAGTTTALAWFWYSQNRSTDSIAAGSKALFGLQSKFIRAAIWNPAQRGTGAFAILSIIRGNVEFSDRALRDTVMKHLPGELNALITAWSGENVTVYSYLPISTDNNNWAFTSRESDEPRVDVRKFNIELGEYMWFVGVRFVNLGDPVNYVVAGGSREYSYWRVTELPRYVNLGISSQQEVKWDFSQVEAAILNTDEHRASAPTQVTPSK